MKMVFVGLGWRNNNICIEIYGDCSRDCGSGIWLYQSVAACVERTRGKTEYSATSTRASSLSHGSRPNLRLISNLSKARKQESCLYALVNAARILYESRLSLRVIIAFVSKPVANIEYVAWALKDR
jgi:hypothetical protein